MTARLFPRSVRRIVLLTAIIQAVATGEVTLADARDKRTEDPGSIGIWKSAVPPVGMSGEFGNHDPIALANGALVKSDCSVNWIDPDSRKLYCFSVPTSMAYFLYWPKANTARAAKEWERMQGGGAATPTN